MRPLNTKIPTPRSIVYTGKNGFQLDHALCKSYGIFPGDSCKMIRVESGEYCSMVFIEGKKRGINAKVFAEQDADYIAPIRPVEEEPVTPKKVVPAINKPVAQVQKVLYTGTCRPLW